MDKVMQENTDRNRNKYYNLSIKKDRIQAKEH